MPKLQSKKPQSADQRGTPRAPTPEPDLFVFRDLVELAGLPPSLLLAWALPGRQWPSATRMMGHIVDRVRPRQGRMYVPIIRRLLAASEVSAGSDHELESERIASHLRPRLELLRMYRPGGWRPDISLVGRERLDAALADGRGAILWVNQFASSDLVTKICWDRAGLPVSHLSRPQHGLSQSRFGLGCLNPIVTHIDERLLRERIVIPPAGLTRPMRLMTRRLSENGIVSITVTDMARRPVTVPFLDGTVRLAPGAAVLAASSGAPLFPIFARSEGNCRFVVEIDEALDVPQSVPPRASSQATLQQLAVRLEGYVSRKPLEWHSWDLYEPSESAHLAVPSEV